MRAMILAAGFGERLRPVTESIPKPALPVVGVPNIVRTAAHLVRCGVREIVVNLHHLPHLVEEALGDGSSFGAAIEYSREDEILGTGGGVRKALPLLGDGAFLVINGDALFAPDIGAAVAAHRRRGGLATLVVRRDPEAASFGAVGLDEGDRIRRLAWAGDPEAGPRVRMFTGVHVIEPEIGPRLPERGCVVRETYAPLVEEGAPVFGADDGGFFRDLGTPGRYLDANVELLTGRARLDDFEPPAGGVHVDPGARVGAGCRLGPGTSICAGASVSPGTSVERAVILPGATVERDFAGAIACPDGRIVEA